MSDSNLSDLIDLEAMLEAAPTAIVVHDLDDKVLFWNHAAEALYGWSAKDIKGHAITGIHYPDIEEREASLRQLHASGSLECTIRQLNNEGAEHLVEVKQFLQYDSEQKPVAVVSFNTPMGDSSDASNSSANVQTLVKLSDGLAHELNNQLAPIMLSAALLKRTLNDEKSQKMLTMIEKSAKRGADLVADIEAQERNLEKD